MEMIISERNKEEKRTNEIDPRDEVNRTFSLVSGMLPSRTVRTAISSTRFLFIRAGKDKTMKSKSYL
jgi:hypothetical protein